jgi:shikimate dehydrogenase
VTGAATAYALLTMGAAGLRIADVDHQRAVGLVDAMRRVFGPERVAAVDAAAALAGADGVVQATPVGMASHPGTPFDPGLLHAGQWLAEVIYFPRETALVRAARQRGCQTLDGAGMAVFQAVQAFELFTGRPADPARMRRAL